MKHIKLKISLEQFRSRFPGSISAFMGEELWEFGINDGAYSNYGLFPYSVMWGGRVVSYNTLNDWYHFLLKYVDILTKSHCATKYASAYDMYAKQPNLYSLQECNYLDDKVSDICGTNGSLQSAQDALLKMAKFFPIFKLTEDVYNEVNIQTKYYANSFKEWISIWGSSTLNIESIFYWMKWFDDNIQYETIDNCEVSNNCCDCVKYHKLGGSKMKDVLNRFILSLTPPTDIVYPYFSVRVPLISNIDNLGEYSIFAEQWEPGKDYQSANNNGGAVIEYNYNDWEMLPSKDGLKLTGYKYSNTFKEIYFGNVDGMSQFEHENYIDNTFGPNDITPTQDAFKRKISNVAITLPKSDYKTYAYNNANEIVFDPTPNGMATCIPIDTNNGLGFFVIGGREKRPENMLFIKYKGLYYKVSTDTDLNPFVIINGITYYAKFECGVGYRFIINDTIIPFINTQKSFVLINNTYKLVANSSVTYNGIVYQNIYGKFTYNNSTKYVAKIKSGTRVISVHGNNFIEDVLTLGEFLDADITSNSAGYNIDNDNVRIYKPYHVYSIQYVVGETDSKLSTFINSSDAVYDDLGNKLPGQFVRTPLKNGSSTIQYIYSSPTENSWLDLYYKPSIMVHATLDTQDDVKTTYWCDFLYSMTFYFSDVNGNKHFETELTANDVILHGINSIDAINECIAKKDAEINNGLDIIKKYGDLSPLKCDIIYYMGALVSRLHEKTDDGLFIYNKGYEVVENTGVKYTDTVYLLPKRVTYYMSETQCYEVNYYDILWDTFDTMNTPQKSSFKVFKTQKLIDNGYVSFPVLREEYKLRSAMQPKVDSLISINRGISRAYDKHIKLLEVKSLEALEQYNNGFFKIINT